MPLDQKKIIIELAASWLDDSRETSIFERLDWFRHVNPDERKKDLSS